METRSETVARPSEEKPAEGCTASPLLSFALFLATLVGVVLLAYVVWKLR